MSQLPDQPTAAEQAEIKVLAKASDRDFTGDLLRYLSKGDDSGRRVFRAPDLIERTYQRLVALRADASKDRNNKRLDPKRRNTARRLEELAAAELRAIAPIRKALANAASDSAPRRQAERLLGEVHLDQLRFLMTHLASGRTGAQAADALRAALNTDGAVAVGHRARANHILGQALPEIRDELERMLRAGADLAEVRKAAQTLTARRSGGPS